MNTTSASLLQRVQRTTDEAAWKKFVELYSPLLYGCVQRAGIQGAAGEDLVQDVFATLVQVLPQFSYEKNGSFRGWLKTIVLNKIRNAVQRASHRREIPSSNLDDAPADELDATWDAEYRQTVVERALRIMRSDFSETTWRVGLALLVSGRSTADVANEFQLTLGAAKAAKVRVLTRLRQELRELLDEF